MRVWACCRWHCWSGGGVRPRPVIQPQLTRPQAPIDPKTLARRLEAMQPGWPAARRIDCAHLKCVALTFDDGPATYTGRLLDLLSTRKVRATFFVRADGRRARGQPSWCAASWRRGTSSATTRGTISPLTGLPDGEAALPTQAHERAVEQVTGVRMRVMRPPYGATNRRVAAEARRQGLAQILWSVDTLDWQDRVPAHRGQARGQGGGRGIVLMHDVHRSHGPGGPHPARRAGRRRAARR